MTIMPRLYPSKMREGSKLYDEFLDYCIEEMAFGGKAEVCFGLISEAEAASRLHQYRRLVAAKRAALKAIPWWAFWRKAS